MVQAPSCGVGASCGEGTIIWNGHHDKKESAGEIFLPSINSLLIFVSAMLSVNNYHFYSTVKYVIKDQLWGYQKVVLADR